MLIQMLIRGREKEKESYFARFFQRNANLGSLSSPFIMPNLVILQKKLQDLSYQVFFSCMLSKKANLTRIFKNL